MQIRDVRITFEDSDGFLEAYEQDLSAGWVFVPSEREFELGEVVEVTLDLCFCGHSGRVIGVVKSRISAALAKMLGCAAGAVIEFVDGIQSFEEMMRDTMESLVQRAWSRSDQSGAPRRHERFDVSVRGHVERAGATGDTRTRNVSQSGALLEVEGVELKTGDQVSLSLVDPATGALVALQARVVRKEPAAEERPAEVAVKFTEPPAPNARKARFLDQVRAVTQGPRMGGISGNLSGLSLPSLLQSIATSSEQGTMEIVGDGVEARILFESNKLRHASLGKVQGIKALARLMEWPEGEFAFQPSVEPDDPMGTLLPIEQAIMEAVHQAEELRRLDGQLLSDEVLVERATDTPTGGLQVTERAVLDALERPGCPSTLLDTLPHSDAEIWQALLALRDRGQVYIRE